MQEKKVPTFQQETEVRSSQLSTPGNKCQLGTNEEKNKDKRLIKDLKFKQCSAGTMDKNMGLTDLNST